MYNGIVGDGDVDGALSFFSNTSTLNLLFVRFMDFMCGVWLCEIVIELTCWSRFGDFMYSA